MRKIALINQRYGLDVNGGSEYYTRLIAGKLKDSFAVEVLTTTALNYDTWDNYYPPGEEEIEGVRVRRFSVDRPRDPQSFGECTAQILAGKKRRPAQEEEWIEEQGPVCGGLISYLRENQDAYDLFIFVTYLYYTTVRGLPQVLKKAVLIPTAHDEPWIYFSVYQDIFRRPRGLIYLTEEEEALVERLFDNASVPHIVAATGVDIPARIDVAAFREKYALQGDYLIYVGRIDPSKGCDVLLRYFETYRRQHPDMPLTLVLMGKSVMEVPAHPDIRYLGFVSDEDKYNGIAGAQALVLPSQYESLSLSVLEAMALGVPVIVNGKCAVLRGHCQKSNGGLYYTDYPEFAGILDWMAAHPQICEELRKHAVRYIDENYRWEVIVRKLSDFLDRIADGAANEAGR